MRTEFEETYKPYSIDAEQVVIASLLTHKIDINDVVTVIDFSDYYLNAHKIIYEAILSITNSGMSPEIIIVLNALGSDLENVGGMAYLAKLANELTVPRNIIPYLNIIKDKSRERQVLDAAHRMKLAIDDDEKKSDEKINDALTIANNILSDEEESEHETIDFLKQSIKNLEHRHENDGVLTSLSTGFKDLDKRLNGLNAGHLIILAARPAMGKTSLALNMFESASFSDRAGASIFFSLEMPGNEVIDKMICSVGGVNQRLMKLGFPKSDENSANEWPKVTYAAQKIKQCQNMIIDDRGGLTLQQIRAKCITTKRKKGLNAVFIDYITYIRTAGKSNRVLEVGEVSRGLKALAKELSCPIICLAQLSRKCEERPNKRPLLSDLRDSGEIEQDADAVLFIYRDDYYNENSDRKGITEINIAKNRGGECGIEFLETHLNNSRFKTMSYQFTPQYEQKEGKKYYGK